jgi:hypothetical protein
VVDELLRELVAGLPAVSVEGAKGVGKTATAQRLAAAVVALDDPGYRDNVAADPRVIATFPRPTLVDEWQLAPAVWDAIRREVDRDRTPGRFILTGSATPAADARLHSGAGRVVRVAMRPMTLPERGATTSTVSFAALLAGRRSPARPTSASSITRGRSSPPACPASAATRRGCATGNLTPTSTALSNTTSPAWAWACAAPSPCAPG